MTVRFPEVEHDRLARRQELEAVGDRQAAVGPAVVLAEGEERDVRLEEVDRLGVLLVQLDLQLHRVGLEVDQPPGGGVLGQRARCRRAG